LAPYPDLLAEYFEIPTQQLPAKSVTDPISSVRADVEVRVCQQFGVTDCVGSTFGVRKGVRRR